MKKALVSISVALFIVTQLGLASGVPIISVLPEYQEVSAGEIFNVNISIDPSGDAIYAAEYELYYNILLLEVVSQTQGDFLSQDGASTFVYPNKYNNTIGKTEYAETRMGVDDGVTNPATLASITFKALGRAGNSTLDLRNVLLINTSESVTNFSINDGLVEIEVIPTSFIVHGYAFYDNGTLCMHPTVKITNMNTSDEWEAETGSDHSFQSELAAGIDLIAGDVLQIRAISSEAEQINTSCHTVTPAEVDAGEISNFNLSLEPFYHDVNISADYFPPTGIKIERSGAVIPPEQTLTVGNVYYIKYNVENKGNVDETVNVTLKVANASGEWIINCNELTIDSGMSYEGNDSWDSSSFAPGSYNIIVNASIPATDVHPDNNERSRAVMLEMPSDITISGVQINPECSKVVNKAFVNEANEICATIWNNGTEKEKAEHFNVSFVISDELINKSLVEELTAGTNVTLCVPWTPVQLGNYQLNVTVDSDDDLLETNESNNVMMMSFSVYNNGYKGKRYTGGEDIKTVQMHDGRVNLSYSVGDSYYLFGLPPFGEDWTQYTVNWSSDDPVIPCNASIEAARLYAYYWDDTTTDIYHYLNLTFNDAPVNTPVLYTDAYNTPIGMLTFDVIGEYIPNAENTAILNNSYPGGGSVSMLGMALLVLYEDAGEPQRVIWINEGCDLLKADADYCVSPTEATAYAAFEDMPAVSENAKLITIASHSCNGDDNNTLYFNDMHWETPWEYAGETYIGFSEVAVTDYISDINVARIRSLPVETGASGDMEASNAILVVEGVLSVLDTGPGTYPSLSGTHNGTITTFYNISVDTVSIRPCAGTGGHIEYFEIGNESWSITATWDGYSGNWHTILFDNPFTLYESNTYNYTIRTGSYPQIIHAKEEVYIAKGGKITCERFTDANGFVHKNWIPAIKMEMTKQNKKEVIK